MMNGEDPHALWFKDQVLDHFAPVQFQENWSQKYYVNSTYWAGEGSPCFFILGGEGPLTSKFVGGYLYASNLARKYRGAVVALEHRYYGKSHPTPDMSTANLKYLSSEQALQDAANFMTNFDQVKPYFSGKTIVLGGSYPGVLSGAFRLKFPHLVAGSVASSAPVNAVVDMSTYNEVIGTSLKYFGGQACYNAAVGASEAVANLIQTESGRDQLSKDFNTCYALDNNPLNLGVFQGGVIGNIQGVIQYNNDHPNPKWNAEKICKVLTESSQTPYVAMVTLNKMMNGDNCMDVSYDDDVDFLKETKWNPNSASRLWFYQTCNEFGYYQTTSSKNEPFYALKHITLDMNLKQCQDVFGFYRLPDVKRALRDYGGLAISGTRIVFVNGSIDPWSSLGVTGKPVNNEERSIFIEGTAHCADLYAPDASDIPARTHARMEIAKLVDMWLLTDQ
eukprot:TRINITY_DN775871_c0_g1_i1.p1 TRINITY_DN775871_c0_g1~~TRINITY_DN775871_c0_g1_i1.p1  ORF type:complete len:496 (-),score=158.63 TRINITY_DN775871_c0_g1_i1:235-1578(-)